MLAVACLLAACASAPPTRTAAAPARGSGLSLPVTGSSANIAFRALGLVGTPYKTAGADPRIGFDCSGFVMFVFRDAMGVALPRSTGEQFALHGGSPRLGSLLTGDLVFFNTAGRGVSHVGIYVGEGRFVHAPNHGGRVRLDRLDDRYWQQRYLGARRILRG